MVIHVDAQYCYMYSFMSPCTFDLLVECCKSKELRERERGLPDSQNGIWWMGLPTAYDGLDYSWCVLTCKTKFFVCSDD